MPNLTEDQVKFMEECTFEFSDRFTDADELYKKVYEDGIPPPPVMYPWYTRSPRYNNRDRAGGSRHQDDGNRNYNQNRDNRRYQDYGNRNYNQDRDSQSYNRGSNYNQHDRRHRPY